MNKYFIVLAGMIGMLISANSASAEIVKDTTSFSSQVVSFGKSSHFDFSGTTQSEVRKIVFPSRAKMAGPRNSGGRGR